MLPTLLLAYPDTGSRLAFSGAVLQPQRLGVGAKRLRNSPGAQQLQMIVVYPFYSVGQKH